MLDSSKSGVWDERLVEVLVQDDVYEKEEVIVGSHTIGKLSVVPKA